MPSIRKAVQVAVAVLTVFAAGNAFAASIGLNFVGGSANGAPTPLAAADVAGVVPQMNWNNGSLAAGSSTVNTGGTLVDSTGASVAPGTTVSWSANGTWGAGNTGNPDEALMNGYIDVTGAPGNTGSVIFTGIPYAQYDVIAYFGSDGDDRTGTISDGTTTFSYNTHSSGGHVFPAEFLQTTDTGGGNPDANYAVWTGETSPSLTITITRGSNNSGFHGIQIIDTTPPVPEPVSAAMALMGLGGLALGLRRRRTA